MARTKVQIAVSELQDAINQLEAVRLFSSPHKLYEAVAGTPWAQALGATPVMVYLRVKEVNVDPDNPVITMKVKAARKVGPRDPNAPSTSHPATTRRAKVTGVTFAGLDVLIDVFQGRGIEITGAEWLVTSSTKSDAENRAIMLAWADLRDRLGLPKPAKKADALAVKDLVATASLSIAEPSIAVGPITVIEEMPDGGPVQEVTLDVTPVELAVLPAQQLPTPVEPTSAPAPVQAVPLPFQVTSVRPVPSRPMPVRSSVPPRPMPVA